MRIGTRTLNDGWAFTKLPLGSTREEAEGSCWQKVSLPHDWLIWQTADLYESADAWYRRRILKEEADAPHVILCFDGVYMDCDVLLNGEIVCSHAYGYTAFQADLSGRIREGENELLVHIRHQSPNTRWYSGSGIYREVTLKTLPENYILPDSLYTVTREDPEGDGGGSRLSGLCQAGQAGLQHRRQPGRKRGGASGSAGAGL